MAIPKNIPSSKPTNNVPAPLPAKPDVVPPDVRAQAAAQSRATVAKSSALTRLAGIAGVSGRQNSEWFTDGEYRVRVTRVREGETRAPGCRPYIAVDATVLESSGDKAIRKGHAVCQMIMLDRDAAARDVRAFLDAVVEARGQDEEVDDDFLASVCSIENPLEGVELDVVAVTVQTKAGAPFTRVSWAAPATSF